MNTTTISQQVAEGIVQAAPSILPNVISTLISQETDRRAKALLSGIELALSIKKDLAKIERPDVAPNYGADGKPLGEGAYTKARVGEIKKLRERLAKVEKAIEKATPEGDTKPDYADLFNLKGLIEQAEKESGATDAS